MIGPALALLLAGVPAVDSPEPNQVRGGWQDVVYPRLDTWDLDCRLAAGGLVPGSGARRAVRVRTGVLLVREPLFWSAGVALELDERAGPALGVEMELTDAAGGGWIQLGTQATLKRRGWDAGAAAGWSIFGVEARHDLAGTGWSLSATLRVPVRIVLHFLTQP